MALIELITACAPLVHPTTMLHIVEAESNGNPWAINVNNGPEVSAEGQKAIDLARRFIQAGYTVDVGLAQINSNNFERLNLSVEKAFDPCENLKAGAQILRENYRRTKGQTLTQTQALDQSLSVYNTGRKTAGIENGYVARVRSADISQYEVPSLESDEALPMQPQPEGWDIFGDLSNHSGRWLKAGESAQ